MQEYRDNKARHPVDSRTQPSSRVITGIFAAVALASLLIAVGNSFEFGAADMGADTTASNVGNGSKSG